MTNFIETIKLIWINNFEKYFFSTISIFLTKIEFRKMLRKRTVNSAGRHTARILPDTYIDGSSPVPVSRVV